MTKQSVEKSTQSLRNRRDNIKSKISTTTTTTTYKNLTPSCPTMRIEKFPEKKLPTNSSMAS